MAKCKSAVLWSFTAVQICSRVSVELVLIIFLCISLSSLRCGESKDAGGTRGKSVAYIRLSLSYKVMSRPDALSLVSAWSSWGQAGSGPQQNAVVSGSSGFSAGRV